MKVKKFKTKEEYLNCKNCGRKENLLSSVKITTTNINYKYKESNIAWRNVHSMKLCKKCFNSFETQLINIEI